MEATYEGIMKRLEVVHWGNKNLEDETKDFLEEIEEGKHFIQELNRQRRILEIEEEDLQAVLEEKRYALEQEEEKVRRSQLEHNKIRRVINIEDY